MTTVVSGDVTHVSDGRPSSSPPVRDLFVVLGTCLVVGLVSAVLWWALVDPAVFTRTKDGGVSMGELQLSKRFDADAWYAVIAAVFGLFAGAALTFWRARDTLLTVLLLVPGSVLAATVTAGLGGLLGPPAPNTVAAHVETGTKIPVALGVSSPVVYLVWPIAVLLGAVIVLWSPQAQQDS